MASTAGSIVVGVRRAMLLARTPAVLTGIQRSPGEVRS